MKARRTRKKANKALLSLLLAALMVAEPAASSAIVYAAEPVNEQTVDFVEDVSEEVENGQDISDETEINQGGSDETGEEQDGSKEDGSDEDGSDESGDDKNNSDENGSDESGDDKNNSDENGLDESGDDKNDSDENGSDETEDKEDGSDEENSDETGDATDDSDEEDVEEENSEEDLEEEEILEEETVEDINNWEGTGHKAPQLEMSLTSAMVAEKVELAGTAERLERLKKSVKYVANEAVFLASSKSYADQVAKGYGATVDSYEDGVAVMTFADDVIDIIAMAEDEKVKLPAVYPNYIYTAFNNTAAVYEQVIPMVDEITTQAATADAYLSTQYYHEEIKSSAAWSYNDTAGNGIKVAVIDSGINKNHEDLKGRVASASTTCSTPYNKAEDNHSHGTHVSGIIAANKDNGLGGAGIAYKSKIVSIKALENNPLTGDANGSTADIIKALNSAVKSGARVINMSLGGYVYDSLYEATVDAAVNKGIVVVVAAGNEANQLSKDKNSPYYCSPACFDNVITVSAKQKDENSLAYFSNYGEGIIDITAPGTNIVSTVPEGNYIDEDGTIFKAKYLGMSGTSQATPMVAATAAYILSVSPDLKNNKTKTAVDTVKKILQDSATSMGNSANFGAGLLNVEEAIKMAAPAAEEKGGTGALQAPTVKRQGGAELKNNDTIQDTDLIELSSALGTTSNNEIKIYYTTDGKAPTEKSALYTGAFKLEASGNKTIKAVAVYYGKKSAVTTIKVKVNAYVQSFGIVSKTGSTYLGAGKSLTLATDAKSFIPAYATNKKVEWAVIGEGATINASGKLTAAKGIAAMTTVTVQATAVDQKTQTATIEITLLPLVTSLKLKDGNPATVDLKYDAGGPAQTWPMQVDIDPAAANVAVSYTSSSEKIATVDSNGLITAVGNGTATITAKATDGSNKKVTMKVKVTKQVQEIKITSKTGELQMAAGKSLQMAAEVTSDATNKKVDWKILSGESYATINASGKLTANKTVSGVQTVQVRADAKDAGGVQSNTLSIQIYPSVTGKVLLEEKTSCSLGTTAIGTLNNSIQLHPYTEKYMEGFFGRKQGSGDTDLANFTYTSSNTNVATVTSTGLVQVNTEGKTGTVKIKVAARDGSGKNVTCTVKVIKPVTTISVYSKTGKKVVGRNKSLSLGALINSDASIKKLEWESSNPNIATVDKNGKVIGKNYNSDGSDAEVTITARATDGSDISQSFTVKVRPAITKLAFWGINSLTLKGSFATTVVDDTWHVNEWDDLEVPYYFDEISGNTTPRSYIGEDGETYAYWDRWEGTTFTCSNSNVLQIVNIDGYYYITAVNKGTATITYKALDGSGKNCKLKIIVKD